LDPTAIALPTAIVDAHHHLWDLREPRYGWLQEAYDDTFFLGDYRAICRDFLPPDLKRQVASVTALAEPTVRLAASVHIEAECDRPQALAETRWLHTQHSLHGLPNAVVAWVDLLAPDADEQLAQQAAFPLVRGVRFKPVVGRNPQDHPTGAGSLHDSRWPQALARLAQHGLRWDLRVPFWHLKDAASMLRDAPALPVVLNHTGLPWDRSPAGLAVWREGLCALASLPNVHVKLSELGLKQHPWDRAENARIVSDALAIFGWQRCLFASNFPVAGLNACYTELISMTCQAMALAKLDAAQQRAVWHDNARAFYDITIEEKSS